MDFHVHQAPAGMEDELRRFYREYKSRASTFQIPKNHGQDTSTLWDKVPEMDSKTVPKCNPIVKKHLNIDITAAEIRYGGNESEDDFITYTVPRLLQRAYEKKTWNPEVLA